MVRLRREKAPRIKVFLNIGGKEDDIEEVKSKVMGSR